MVAEKRVFCLSSTITKPVDTWSQVTPYTIHEVKAVGCEKLFFSFTLLKQVKLTAKRQRVFDAELVQEVLNIY